jgi:hypothetical protein
MQSSTAILDLPMPKQKKAGRPATSTRDDVVVKIDRGIVAKARYVADTRGIPLAEYLSEALRPVVGRDFDRTVRGSEAEGGGK